MERKDIQSEAGRELQEQLSASKRPADVERRDSSSSLSRSTEAKVQDTLGTGHAKSARRKRAINQVPSPTHRKKKQKLSQSASGKDTKSDFDSGSTDEIVPESQSDPGSSKRLPKQDTHIVISNPSNRKQSPKKDHYALEAGTDPNVENWIQTRPSIQGKTEGRAKPQRECQYIADDEWQCTVDVDQSAEIINSDTGEIWGYVIRDFVGDNDVLEHINQSSKAHCELVANGRREDPGSMGLFAYGHGPRNNQEFTPCRNLIKAARWTEQELKLHNHRMHSASTIIWNIGCKKLPPSIIEPMVNEMGKYGMPRADWCSMGDPKFQPIVSLQSGGQSHELTGLECGPPSALCASMYSRCHSEPAPAKAPFVISFSTECTPGHGGNFYMQDIGVRIKNAKNTLIVHRANELHETTVHEVDHGDKNLTRVHRKFCLLIANKLANLWQQDQNKKNGLAVYDSKGRVVLSAEEAALSSTSKSKHHRNLSTRTSRDNSKAKKSAAQGEAL